MGSQSSKLTQPVAKAAASAASGASRRQYPTRIPNQNPSTTSSPSPATNTQEVDQPSSPARPNFSSYPNPDPSSSISSPSTFAATSSAAATVHPPPYASPTKDSAILNDASDPHFAASLRSLGVVKPASTMSNSSTVANSSGPSPYPSSSSSFSSSSSSSPSFVDRDGVRVQSGRGGVQNPIAPTPTGRGIKNRGENIGLRVLRARDRIARDAEAEFAKVRIGEEPSSTEFDELEPTTIAPTSTQAEQDDDDTREEKFEGRTYLDIGTIRTIVRLRDAGQTSEQDIERRFGLKRGLVAGLVAIGLPETGQRIVPS